MRQIKFRAYVNNGAINEIIYPDVIMHNSPISRAMSYKFGFKPSLVEDNEPFSNDWSLVKDMEQWERDIVFMQYTGLKDDNGVDLYEGDIITNIKGELLAIEWNDDTCKWQFSNGDDINDGETYSSYKVVVGNVYENAELLETKTNAI